MSVSGVWVKLYGRDEKRAPQDQSRVELVACRFSKRMQNASELLGLLLVTWVGMRLSLDWSAMPGF